MNKEVFPIIAAILAMPMFKKNKGSANYNINGLEFWSEDEIEAREQFVHSIVSVVKKELKSMKVVRVEAPILTPDDEIYEGYDKKRMFSTSDNLTLRPQTTMGSYSMAKELIKSGQEVPFVVWQHGKSFRREQKKTKKHMRLKEFYQLEFQVIYKEVQSIDTDKLIKAVKAEVQKFVGRCRIVKSKPPHYAKWTKDIEMSSNSMEIASISERTDFNGYKVLEIAIGTDRAVYNHFERKK